jgi:hypothetical protein
MNLDDDKVWEFLLKVLFIFYLTTPIVLALHIMW